MAAETYVVLEGSKVVNVIMWDSDVNVDADYTAPEGQSLRLATGNEGIGWELVDDEWVPPLVIEIPAPVEDPSVVDAKYSALKELTDLGVSDKNARIIVGLPPAEVVPA